MGVVRKQSAISLVFWPALAGIFIAYSLHFTWLDLDLETEVLEVTARQLAVL